MCRSKAYKRYGRWYNYHGRRIRNVSGYFKAVKEDRYGFCQSKHSKGYYY